MIDDLTGLSISGQKPSDDRSHDSEVLSERDRRSQEEQVQQGVDAHQQEPEQEESFGQSPEDLGEEVCEGDRLLRVLRPETSPAMVERALHDQVRRRR